MPRTIAFLRAINVGGHTVKMDILRRHFESLGLAGVETFIASGNVIFETPSRNIQILETIIEKELREAFGYEVVTFLRTGRELADIAEYTPFRRSDLGAAVAFNVAFLKKPLDGPSVKKLATLGTDIDDFHFHEREVYWLCRRKQSESTFSNAVLEKTLGIRSTLRGMNTIQELTAKYAGKTV
jgi:uncharacterized protein (DUF1697 family)